MMLSFKVMENSDQDAVGGEQDGVGRDRDELHTGNGDDCDAQQQQQ